MFFLEVIGMLIYVGFIIIFVIGIYNLYTHKVPQVGTFNSDFKVMKNGLKKYNLKGKKIVDLGSGSGRVLRFFEKEFKMNTTGYEIDLGNILISKTLNVVFGYKSIIIKTNYFKKDLSQYEVVYIYLYTELMHDIEKKIWNESKKGTLIISNAFKMPNKKPINILVDDKGKEEVYIYKV